MELEKNQVLRQYEISGKIIFDSELTGDYKAANREARKLLKIFKIFEKKPAFADECIPMLLKSQNVVVRSKGAAYCLALKRDTDQGESVLKEISNDTQYGIWRLNAEMTLKQWYAEGRLILYTR